SHIAAMGFAQFHTAIDRESVQKAVLIFTDQTAQKAVLIFVTDIFLGSADRLNLPYVFWYAVIGFLGYRIFKHVKTPNTSRFFLFSAMVLFAFLLYLFLLYCMQIIIFGLGSSSDQTLGFSRYLNIVFSPIVFIAVLVFFQQLVFSRWQISPRICIASVVVVLVLLGASRVEVYLNREKLDIHVQKVSGQIAGKIEKGVHSIGVITNKTDNLANLQFLFYLLPNKVDYLPDVFETRADLMAYVAQHDYIICYRPRNQIFEWLKPFLKEQHTDLPDVTVLRVHADMPQSGSDLLLERISF
ncbi:MAG: hypothetical protein KKH99_05550, partial [Proteobacteria bacterium]|nr:hypothetical protein [Pseudomonadota bacterium]